MAVATAVVTRAANFVHSIGLPLQLVELTCLWVLSGTEVVVLSEGNGNSD